MGYFIYILINIITPIFLQIGVGYYLCKRLSIDTSTLAKVQFYIFIPALLFVKMYESTLDGNLIVSIGLHSFVLFVVLYLFSFIITKLCKLSRDTTSAFINSICFYNSGNYCIPLVQILFNNPGAMSIQLFIMMFQNIATNTVGVVNTKSGEKEMRQGLLEVLKVPMLYAVIAALLLKSLNIKIWTPLWFSLDSLGKGLVPLALVTLGAQLAKHKFTLSYSSRVYCSNFIRLIVSPALAYLLVLLMGIHGEAAQILIISSAAPTAVNAVLLAIQYGREPEYASQVTLTSTLFSAFTVSLTIFLVMHYL